MHALALSADELLRHTPPAGRARPHAPHSPHAAGGGAAAERARAHPTRVRRASGRKIRPVIVRPAGVRRQAAGCPTLIRAGSGEAVHDDATISRVWIGHSQEGCCSGWASVCIRLVTAAQAALHRRLLPHSVVTAPPAAPRACGEPRRPGGPVTASGRCGLKREVRQGAVMLQVGRIAGTARWCTAGSGWACCQAPQAERATVPRAHSSLEFAGPGDAPSSSNT